MLRSILFGKNQVLALFVSLSLLSGSFAWAWPPTYGAEFELTSFALAHNGSNLTNATAMQSPEKKEQMRYVDHMRERCLVLGCDVVGVPGKWGDQDFKVQYPDGWYFKVSYDPGCVEITFKPSTLEVLQEKAALINDHIFKTGEELEMKVDRSSMAHFNIGIRSAFDDNGKEFLKFFIDYQNHADLALGSLGDDIYNAPPLAVLGNKQREAMQAVIDDVNAGKFSSISQNCPSY